MLFNQFNSWGPIFVNFWLFANCGDFLNALVLSVNKITLLNFISREDLNSWWREYYKNWATTISSDSTVIFFTIYKYLFFIQDTSLWSGTLYTISLRKIYNIHDQQKKNTSYVLNINANVIRGTKLT